MGFGFQADVVNAGSLAHFLTGRILKALSDGKVDFYALAASIWLGKQIPVRSALETTVHPVLASRTGFQGVLAQALSIGWGHSDVAIEMSRTKAGTNALLLIGAISTGCSYFGAAQILSELLVISGCEADQIPTVDVLRPLVAYLAPFVRDLSFGKVLHHVTASAEHIAVRRLHHIPASLTATGEAPVLAAAIKQLTLTSRRGETVYFNTYQRGAWLAVFASHILGMSVELLLDDTMLWASAGTNGAVAIQIGRLEARGSARTSLKYAGAQTSMVLVEPPCTPEGKRPLTLDCSLAEALDASLGRHPLIDQNLRGAIHSAIANLSRDLAAKLRMKTSRAVSSTHNINGQFDYRVPLVDTLSHFGINEEVVQRSLCRVESWCNGTGWIGSPTEINGLEHLDGMGVQYLRQSCPTHKAGPPGGKLGRCLCCYVGGIIHGFASSTVALLQCRYNAEQIRVRAALLDGTVTTSWVRGCILENGESSIALDGRQLLNHLSQLLHGGDSDVPNESEMQSLGQGMHILGISGGSTTVYYTLVLSDDCYDTHGRQITISSGRASVNGVLRQIIVEKTTDAPPIGEPSQRFPPPKTTRIAVGTYLQSHYCPGDQRIFMDAMATEHEIRISTAVGCDLSRAESIILSQCIHAFLEMFILRTCEHPSDDPWKITDPRHVVLVSPFSASPNTDRPATHVVYALRGRKLEQLVQCAVESVTNLTDYPSLQLFVCLRCASEFVPVYRIDFERLPVPWSRRVVVMT